jgi:hypothetical protein
MAHSSHQSHKSRRAPQSFIGTHGILASCKIVPKDGFHLLVVHYGLVEEFCILRVILGFFQNKLVKMRGFEKK